MSSKKNVSKSKLSDENKLLKTQLDNLTKTNAMLLNRISELENVNKELNNSVAKINQDKKESILKITELENFKKYSDEKKKEINKFTYNIFDNIKKQNVDDDEYLNHDSDDEKNKDSKELKLDDFLLDKFKEYIHYSEMHKLHENCSKYGRKINDYYYSDDGITFEENTICTFCTHQLCCCKHGAVYEYENKTYFFCEHCVNMYAYYRTFQEFCKYN